MDYNGAHFSKSAIAWPPNPPHGFRTGERKHPLNVPGWELEMRATAAVIDRSPPVEEPIRAELFGIERLEEHAESLAAAHHAPGEPSRGRNLLPRVRENARVLLAGYRNIAETVLAKLEIVISQ